MSTSSRRTTSKPRLSPGGPIGVKTRAQRAVSDSGRPPPKGMVHTGNSGAPKRPSDVNMTAPAPSHGSRQTVENVPVRESEADSPSFGDKSRQTPFSDGFLAGLPLPMEPAAEAGQIPVWDSTDAGMELLDPADGTRVRTPPPGAEDRRSKSTRPAPHTGVVPRELSSAGQSWVLEQL